MDRRGFLKSLFGVTVAVAMPASFNALAEVVALPAEKIEWVLQVYGVKVPIKESDIDVVLELAQSLINEMDWKAIAKSSHFNPEDTNVLLYEVA